MEMRRCPFCTSNRTKVVDKWGSGEGYWRPRVAYVRCMACNARGSTVKTDEYDIRNEKPIGEALRDLHTRAVRAWNATQTIRTEEDFKLESEVVR